MAIFGNEQEKAGLGGKERFKGVLWGFERFMARHIYIAVNH